MNECTQTLAQARAVLQRVRKHVEEGRWIQLAWRHNNARCLHGHLGAEIEKVENLHQLAGLSGYVFRAVWLSLPDWAGGSIPHFNDDIHTTKEDVLRVIDVAESKLV